MGGSMGEGEIVAITGAGGALGAAVVEALTARGARFVLLDGAAKASVLEARARELGGARAVVVTGDLADEATWRRALECCVAAYGRAPDAAAFIAGGWAGAALFGTDGTRLSSVLRTNVETVYQGFRALLPAMVAEGRGSVVVVGSRAAPEPWTSAGAPEYGASKAAVVALAQATAASVKESGVRVNAILPSTMDTPANRAAMPDVDPSTWVSLPSAAGVVAFLLSDAAKDISGAAVPVYGRA